MICDICGGTEPPRNPYWRDNVTKTCDPCEARLTDAIAAKLDTPAASPFKEGNAVKRVTMADFPGAPR